ncbi:acetyltransferase [Escherichia coli]|nr:acetyltransferase [Escherichia coli]MCI3325560.1 acetyltransferase [Escherichia coli]MCI3350916.1 acetyltransferase [Escherichia coli]
MMCLKYPKPEVMTEVMPGGSVFFLPPQGKPGVADLAQPHLQRLRSQLERRLGTLHRVVCQPQRVGQSSSVAVTAEGACGEVHLLLTVGGHESWPSEEEYRHPRWHIQVVDAADLFYLLLWLCDGGQEA